MGRRSRRIALAPRREQRTRTRTGTPAAAARRYLGYIARNSRTQRRAERAGSTRIRAVERAPHRQRASLCRAHESTPASPASSAATHARARSLRCSRSSCAARAALLALRCSRCAARRSSLQLVLYTRPARDKGTRARGTSNGSTPRIRSTEVGRPFGRTAPTCPGPPFGVDRRSSTYSRRTDDGFPRPRARSRFCGGRHGGRG